MHRVLIFEESGTCLFNLQFQSTKMDDIFDEHLVSSFLTALGNFSDAIFDEKIQQINYKQMSLVLMSYLLSSGKRLISVAVTSISDTTSAIQRMLYDLMDEFVKGGFYKPHFKNKSFDKKAREVVTRHIFGRTAYTLFLGALSIVVFSLLALFVFLFFPRPHDTLSFPLLFLGAIVSGILIGSKRVAVYILSPLSIIISVISVYIADILAASNMVIPIAYPETLFFVSFGLSMTGALFGSYLTELLFLYPFQHNQHMLYNFHIGKSLRRLLKKHSVKPN